jgi:hypothetical protein
MNYMDPRVREEDGRKLACICSVILANAGNYEFIALMLEQCMDPRVREEDDRAAHYYMNIMDPRVHEGYSRAVHLLQCHPCERATVKQGVYDDVLQVYELLK